MYWFQSAFDRQQKPTVYLVIPVHQVLYLTTQDLDVGRPQQKRPESANHLPSQLQLHTRPEGYKRQQSHSHLSSHLNEMPCKGFSFDRFYPG